MSGWGGDKEKTTGYLSALWDRSPKWNIYQEKIDIIYQYRRDQYEKLTDAVYYRRGWTPNGVPTPQKMKALGFTDKKILSMLQKKIADDEKTGHNKWMGNYTKKESPPTTTKRYWEKK